MNLVTIETKIAIIWFT